MFFSSSHFSTSPCYSSFCSLLFTFPSLCPSCYLSSILHVPIYLPVPPVFCPVRFLFVVFYESSLLLPVIFPFSCSFQLFLSSIIFSLCSHFSANPSCSLSCHLLVPISFPVLSVLFLLIIPYQRLDFHIQRF